MQLVENFILILPAATAVIGLVICAVVGIRRERREWNGGVCAKSGKKWVFWADNGLVRNGRVFSDGEGNYILIVHGSDVRS